MRLQLRTPLLVAATAAVLATAVDARAASDYFLRLDGIKGESADDTHKGEIDVLSWSWGIAQAATGSGSGARAGKSCPSDLTLTKFIDSATPPIIASAAAGTVIPTAILYGRKSGGREAATEYLKVELKNVLVSSFQTSGADGSGAPVDAVSLKFQSMTVSYKPQKPDGSLGDAVVASIAGC